MKIVKPEDHKFYVDVISNDIYDSIFETIHYKIEDKILDRIHFAISNDPLEHVKREIWNFE